MYAGDRILALIPARGGSKGIKNKNITNLAGKPLISYSIEAALNSSYIDRTVVTTDSEAIAKVSLSYGADVPFLRPLELARDTSKTIDAVLHAIDMLKAQGEEFDVLVLLQPTQPLRSTRDIDESIECFFSNGGLPLTSVSPVNDHPLLIRSINGAGKLAPLLALNSTCRRQDMPEFYNVNGCIYINKISELSVDTSFNDNMIPFIMAKERSVDIDEHVDLVLAEYYLSSQ